jgi:hypothetical protein
MGKRATELCPFCGDLFVTGRERGDHIRAAHREAFDAVMADYQDARFFETAGSPSAG